MYDGDSSRLSSHEEDSATEAGSDAFPVPGRMDLFGGAFDDDDEGGAAPDPAGPATARLEPPSGTALTARGEVTSAIEAAFTESVAAGREEGGWIYWHPRTGALQVVRATPGKAAEIDLGDPPVIAECFVIANFHTHPNRSDDPDRPYNAQPGISDIQNAVIRKVPGIVRSHEGYHVYGEDARTSFRDGEHGYPSGGAWEPAEHGPLLMRSYAAIQRPPTRKDEQPQSSGAGAPLPPAVLRKMGRAFDTDFADVRVHESDRAGQLGALAVAQGNELHFAPGRYDPTSIAGQELIGHELAHVVQQRRGRVTGAVQTKGGRACFDPSLEAEADRQGERAARGLPAGADGDGGASTVAVADAPMQAKLGFEFQTEWRLYKKPSGGGKVEHVPSKSEAMRLRAPGGGWHIEVDDDDLELVLDPPLETPAAIGAVVGEMASKAQEIVDAAGGSREDFPADKIGWPTPRAYADEGAELVVRPRDPEIGAHAQATMGIGLDRLEQLFRFLAQPWDTMNQRGASPAQRALFAERAEVSKDQLEAHHRRRVPKLLKPKRTTLRTFEDNTGLREVATHTLAEVDRIAVHIPDTMPALRGFLSLITYYLLRMHDHYRAPARYPKSQFQLMARNDFVTAFSALPPAERAHFRRLVGVGADGQPEAPLDGALHGAGGVLEHIRMPSDTGMFAAGYEHPHDRSTLHGPDATAWLRSIAAGYSESESKVIEKDALSPPPGYTHRADAPAHERESMGSLDSLEVSHRLAPGAQLGDDELVAEGQAPTDPRFEQLRRVVLELRDFGHWIPAATWQTHAVAMAELLAITTGELTTSLPRTGGTAEPPSTSAAPALAGESDDDDGDIFAGLGGMTEASFNE